LPGDLDPSFGSGGKVSTVVGSASYGYAMATYPNGDFVVAGSSKFGDYDFAVARYDQLGNLDNAFGVNGKATLDLAMGDEGINAVALQTDGKIVLAGYKGSTGQHDFLLLRLNSDGTLDSTFGSGGIVLPPGSSSNDILWTVAIQPDGRIVTAGQFYNASHFDFFVARYLQDGTPDSTFGFGGIQITDCGTGSLDYPRSLAIAADGKIVVGGSKTNSALSDFVVVRYNTDGSLDGSFGVSGIVSTDFGSYEQGYSLAIDSDDRILLVGSVKPTVIADANVMGMARYNPDGSLDASFGNNGWLTTTGFGDYECWWSVALQDTSRIIVAATSNPTIPSDFTVARYLTNGELDLGFGSNGVVVTDMFTKGDQVRAVALHTDSKILVAGYSGSTDGIHFSVARYLSHIVSGLSSPNVELATTVHPNPIKSEAILEYTLSQSEVITIYLTDIHGRIVMTYVEDEYQVSGHHEKMIAMPEHLASGTYMVVISSPAGQTTVQVVK
jgi:uncharacterized delta-60 repeat protein